MISLFGTITMRLSGVRILVARRPISITSPHAPYSCGADHSSTRSPTLKGRSTISSTPAMRFDSVSLAASESASPATPAPASSGVTWTPIVSSATRAAAAMRRTRTTRFSNGRAVSSSEVSVRGAIRSANDSRIPAAKVEAGKARPTIHAAMTADPAVSSSHASATRQPAKKRTERSSSWRARRTNRSSSRLAVRAVARSALRRSQRNAT